MAFTTRSILFASCAITALALSGCQANVGIDQIDGVGFSCFTDDDCLVDEGFFCAPLNRADGERGNCVQSTGTGEEECFDRDSDGFSVGPDCQAGLQLDCDDDDPNINPAADEVCDGVDNDCDDSTDEEIPPRPCRLQIGLCAGAVVSCTDGAFPDCATVGLYPEGFELVETSCDGIDNNCNGDTDEQCECQPGIDGAVQCGSDTGACSRGIEVCNDNGTLSECVSASIGSACTTDADCGANGFCVEEQINPNEDLFDACTPTDASACRQNVCRTLEGTTACATDGECLEGESCVLGACQALNTRSLGEELCNGIDDNCDGRIDDDGSRLSICGPCPWNMVLVDIELADGSRGFICVDQYEASMSDATDSDMGSFDAYSTSQPGVVPWTGIDPDSASAACQATAYAELFGGGFAQPLPRKRLCSTFEYEQACGGTNGTASQTAYPYGDEFVAGNCVDNTLGTAGPALTGSFDTCSRFIRGDGPQGDQATWDMSGNVGEWVRGAGNLPFLAGGSYLDDDTGGGSALACDAAVASDSVPSPYGDSVGFRCCTLRAQ